MLMLLGIRGRLDEKSPIRVGTAYYSKYPFFNQLGLNANFTLVRSYLDNLKDELKGYQFYDVNESKKAVASLLKIDSVSLIKGVTRMHYFPEKNSYNVVLVLMESMTAKNMKRYGNSENLTPFLDSLANLGYTFENTYSSGIHTYNGIFSTLYSYPALLHRHMLNQVELNEYDGLSWSLKDYNYSTIFFTTHDDQFDNMGGFLRANAFDLVINKSDYPREEILSTLGVPDHILFRHSIKKMKELSTQEKPFFITMLTASNHNPVYSS